MAEGRKRRRAVELCKDVLIVALSLSAVYLAMETQLSAGVWSLLREDKPTPTQEQVTSQAQAEAARPIRMAVMTANESGGLYGVQYDLEESDRLFQASSDLFREALAGVDAPQPVSEEEWRRALSTAPGIHMDMLGHVPLSVLSVWLSGQSQPQLTAHVRRLVLTVVEEETVLLYRDEEERPFSCRVEGMDPRRLTTLAQDYAGNGSSYAFQAGGHFDAVGPYTMLSGRTIAPKVYLSADPIGGERGLERLVELMGFDMGTNFVYTADATVIRNGTDTLRLEEGGRVTYYAAEGEPGRYPIPGAAGAPTLVEVVEYCRALAWSALGETIGQARLCLSSVREEGETMRVDFRYVLDGAQVELPGGWDAATFQVRGGEVAEMSLYFRTYTDSGETDGLLPEMLAAAAMGATDQAGDELTLIYYDGGQGRAEAGWAAHADGTG